MKPSAGLAPLSAWRTVIHQPGLRSVGDFHSAFEMRGLEISGDITYNVLRRLTESVSHHERQERIVRVQVRELGFQNGTSSRAVVDHAEKLGFYPCSTLLAPQLRLQYCNQPDGEEILVGMRTVLACDGHLHAFSLVSKAGRGMLATYRHPCYCRAEDVFVFTCS